MDDEVEQIETTREGRKRRGGLFVNDTEILERLNVPEKEGRRVLRKLDDDPRSGFPAPIEAWGGRRYWPAVKEFFDRAYGFQSQATGRPWVRGGRPQERRSA